MARQRTSKPRTTPEYSKSVPAQLVLSSAPYQWNDLEFSELLFPNRLEEAPTPPLRSHAFAMLSSGAVDGECSINRGPWMPRYSDYGMGEMDFWPQGYEINWRWRPVGEIPAPVKIATVFIKKYFLEQVAAETFDINAVDVSLINKLSVRDEFVKQLVLSVKDELERGNPCGIIYSETAAQMLALHLLSKHCFINHKVELRKGGFSETHARKVLGFINENLQENISLHVLATLIGVSEYHFLRLFKASFDETPLQYIIRLRMDRAKYLLKKTTLSVTEVGLEVGYESVSHFITLFKRHTGVTPVQFQRQAV